MASTADGPKTPTVRARPRAGATTQAAVDGSTRRGLSAKMTPTYVAPNDAAKSASAARVRPQNLTSTLTLSPSHSDEPRDGSGGITRRRHRRPDEHRVRTGGGGALDVGPRRDAALGDRNPVRRNGGEETIGHGRIDLERLEVPAVDADDGVVDRKRERELVVRTHLDQRFESEGRGFLRKAAELARGQRTRDE